MSGFLQTEQGDFNISLKLFIVSVFLVIITFFVTTLYVVMQRHFYAPSESPRKNGPVKVVAFILIRLNVTQAYKRSDFKEILFSVWNIIVLQKHKTKEK